MYISPVSNYHFNNISFTKKKIPVYSIDSDGNYERFNSRSEAAKKLGITAPEINRSAAKRFHKAKGLFFVNADEIETKKENGEIVVYQEDIDKLLEYRTKEKEIYAFDIHGNYLKFASQTEASKELGIDGRTISSIILDERRSTKGYFFAPASKIESKDELGRIFVDREKINNIINREKYSHPIYAIDKKGNYRKFSNQAQAAQELGISRQRIGQVINSINSSCNGYYIVDANQVESKDDDGRMLIDKAKIEKMLIEKSILRRSRSSGKLKQIYAIDSKGNYKKFASRQEASEVLGISVSTIGSIIIGEQKTSHGLTFVNANQIEKTSQDKETIVDSDILSKIIKKRFPKSIFLS